MRKRRRRCCAIIWRIGDDVCALCVRTFFSILFSILCKRQPRQRVYSVVQIKTKLKHTFVLFRSIFTDAHSVIDWIPFAWNPCANDALLKGREIAASCRLRTERRIKCIKWQRPRRECLRQSTESIEWTLTLAKKLTEAQMRRKKMIEPSGKENANENFRWSEVEMKNEETRERDEREINDSILYSNTHTRALASSSRIASMPPFAVFACFSSRFFFLRFRFSFLVLIRQTHLRLVLVFQSCITLDDDLAQKKRVVEKKRWSSVEKKNNGDEEMGKRKMWISDSMREWCMCARVSSMDKTRNVTAVVATIAWWCTWASSRVDLCQNDIDDVKQFLPKRETKRCATLTQTKNK